MNCPNCGQPHRAHCDVHLFRCCPGKCPGLPRRRLTRRLRRTADAITIFPLCLPGYIWLFLQVGRGELSPFARFLTAFLLAGVCLSHLGEFLGQLDGYLQRIVDRRRRSLGP